MREKYTHRHRHGHELPNTPNKYTTPHKHYWMIKADDSHAHEHRKGTKHKHLGDTPMYKVPNKVMKAINITVGLLWILTIAYVVIDRL